MVVKLIIAGSRTLDVPQEFIEWAVQKSPFFKIGEVVCGGANGIDESGDEWAEEYEIPVKFFYADWDTHGKAAGPIRNKQMAEYADALLLIWDGESKGSANMKEEMKKLGKPVYEIILKGATND